MNSLSANRKKSHTWRVFKAVVSLSPSLLSDPFMSSTYKVCSNLGALMTATLEFNPAEKTCNNFPLKSSKNVFTSLRLAKSFRPWLREQEAQRPVHEIVLSCKPFLMQLSLICLLMFLRPLIYTYNYSFCKDNCRGHDKSRHNQ